MAGLNLDKLSELQKRVRDQMFCRGFPDHAEDASQEYALTLLEGKSQHQLIDFFCTDYIRKHFGDSRNKNTFTTIRLNPKHLEKLLYFDGRESLDNEIDYQIIMKRVLAIENNRQRRIMILYFFSGLYPSEIARREGIQPISVFQSLRRAIRKLQTSLAIESLEAV